MLPRPPRCPTWHFAPTHVASHVAPTHLALQVAGKRKKLLSDMAGQMADEVRDGLVEETADQASKMVQSKLELMLEEEAQAFNNDLRFQRAVDEALLMKRSGELAAILVGDETHTSEGGLGVAIERVEPLQGNVVDLTEMALGDGGADVKVAVAWMRSIPSGLTKLKVDLPKSNAEVMATLRELVAKTTTLVELDMMEGGNGKPNLYVLQLNGTDKVKSMDLKNKSLGPMSAAIIAVCIQRNTVLESLECALHLTGASHHIKACPQHSHTRAHTRAHAHAEACP